MKIRKNRARDCASHRGAAPHTSLFIYLREALALALAFLFAVLPIAPVSAAAPPVPKAPKPSAAGGPASGCDLDSAHRTLKHVIYIQFDNVHFTRDNPNVPSDLEQMPNLLDFLTDNGVLLSNHHTPLKSHTADDIITSLTGVYGDRHGMPVANSFDYFTPPGTNPPYHYLSSFQYWTDIVNSTLDPRYFMITPDGKNAPAPWVPWTRAGCNVGAVSTANMELENVSGDIKTVFASDPTVLSAALAEVKSNYYQAVADFEGIAIHCAAGNALCSSANHGQPDVLPDEPGGYIGFNALYGHKFVAPAISSTPLMDLDGNPITDNSAPPNTGFPGFGGISAAQSLAYVATMQENGVPVTYAYISDVHDNHSGDTAYGPAVCATDPEYGALGPGDVCYVAQLKAYDEAFGKFFARLAADGINKNNTLFVITADEGDHFAGGPPSPSDCDGVSVPCTYAKLGEIDSNMVSLLGEEDPNTLTTPFDIQFDMVPVFYLSANPAVGSSVAREFERDAAKLMHVSPITNMEDQLTLALADPVELKLLHMITGDPQRTPTFIMFGNPDWYWQTYGPDAVENAGYAWNHGGIQKEVVTTWLGLVGPGIRPAGIDDDIWSDHTDIRPTMLALAGLQDDYQHEGRVLAEVFYPWALPDGIRDSGDEFVELARSFKQINAPNADLGRTSLRISTKALASGNAMDDSKYTQLENELANITSFRDALASAMLSRLEDAAFHGKRISGGEAAFFTFQADALLFLVHAIEAGA
jgi:arylsulfatase A-like enzyme